MAGAKACVRLGFVGATAPADPAQWRFLTVRTVPRALLPGLVSGSNQWVCCVAAGKDPGSLSEPVSCLVL